MRDRTLPSRGGIPEWGSSDALLVVDVQNDFCAGGRLAVDDADQIIPLLNRLIEAARRGGATIVASRDWHPPNHVSFQDQGGTWPLHCVQDSAGAAFHPDLQLPEDAWEVRKGASPDRDQYSALDGTGLATRLKEAGIRRVWVGGLALDVCVRATALDAMKAGFETHLLLDATRAVNLDPGDGRAAVRELADAGVIIESSEPQERQ